MSDWRRYVVATPLTIALLLAAVAVGSVTAVVAAAGGGDDKISVCHNGRLIDVSPDALADHQGHGDTTEPCPAQSGVPNSDDGPGIEPLLADEAIVEKTTLCHNGHTINVGPNGLVDHTAHNDTLGPCASGDIKSNNAGGRSTIKADNATDERATICHRGRSLTVSATAIADHLDHGDLAGACATGPSSNAQRGGQAGPQTAESIPDGKAAVCHHGRTLVVGEDGFDEHVAHGDSNGPCTP